MDKRILFSVFLFIIIIISSMINIEKFTINDIMTMDQLANEDYKSCLNENSEIYYKSNGKYPNCYVALNQLTSWGGNPNDNIGFGKMKDICPVSCLERTPSDCLEKRIIKQNIVIKDIADTISNSTTFEPIHRGKINNDIDKQSAFTQSLYQNKEVSDAVNYMYTYGYPVSDTIYNDILLKYKNQSESTPNPTGMLLNSDKPGYISSNNANMALSRDKNTSQILGY
jgi:hypothetical protein